MHAQDIEKYVQSTRLLSDQITKQELRVILRELQSVITRGITGDMVEFGCFVGTTSVHLQKLGQGRKLWLYDSFEGLPVKRPEDISPVGEQFKAGELHATKAQLIKNFKSQGVSLPHIKKAWFSDLTPADVPNEIALAFLDGDYYDSIMDPLKLIWPRLSKGATVIVDDYMNEALPGARKAVDEWCNKHNISVKTEASLAIFTR
jgi:O-methyltransferase